MTSLLSHQVLEILLSNLVLCVHAARVLVLVRVLLRSNWSSYQILTMGFVLSDGILLGHYHRLWRDGL